MNMFQKQLLLKNDKSMAELSSPAREGVGLPLPPQKVSVEEFAFEGRCEDHKGLTIDVCKRCGARCFGFLCAECLR